MKHREDGELVHLGDLRVGTSGAAWMRDQPWTIVTVDRRPGFRDVVDRVGARGLVLIAGILMAPLVITGYLGLAVLFVPLFALRRIFPRRRDDREPVFREGSR
jgi:hypothetical protein